jgi:(heptosyl)LPS beta-1,4-glucosyltransferase
MVKLSVVINTLNEEKNLARAVSSVKGLAEEVVVVDMKSDDKTQEVAKKLGAQVFEHPRMDYVEPARNFAIAKATGDWILILDADEEVPETLVKKIIRELKAPGADYFRIPRKNLIFGKWVRHSNWWPDYNIRLFKKGAVSWSEVIHSVPMTQGKGMDFPDKEEYALVHHHYQSISQYLVRLDRYSSIQSKDLLQSGYNFKWQDLIKNPGDEFLRRYFAAEGYKDGVHGLALSLLQSFYELVVILKVWEGQKFVRQDIEIDRFNESIGNTLSDFNYWKADVEVKQKGGVLSRLKRKFKLP